MRTSRMPAKVVISNRHSDRRSASLVRPSRSQAASVASTSRRSSGSSRRFANGSPHRRSTPVIYPTSVPLRRASAIWRIASSETCIGSPVHPDTAMPARRGPPDAWLNDVAGSRPSSRLPAQTSTLAVHAEPDGARKAAHCWSMTLKTPYRAPLPVARGIRRDLRCDMLANHKSGRSLPRMNRREIPPCGGENPARPTGRDGATYEARRQVSRRQCSESGRYPTARSRRWWPPRHRPRTSCCTKM